jgi:cytosine/adenosine deaminase-related metal-dependent hydrolase
MRWEIINASLVGESGISGFQCLEIDRDRIVQITNASNESIPISLDLSGFWVYPALINSHDHLIGTYSPKVGGKTKYISWLSWDNELKSSLVFSERQTLSIDDLYHLGAWKNRIGGAGVVMDHVPHFLNEKMFGKIPIQFVEKYRLSHSVGKYTLDWGEGTALEYLRASKEGVPFVTHLAEGLDEDSIGSLRYLQKDSALGEFSVLVHCLPFGKKEMDQIAQANASIVWCPGSNIHIFGQTTPVLGFRKAGVNICLGTDLAMAGTSFLMDEMRLAKKLFQEMYSEELSSKEVFQMVTKNPAKAFRIDSDFGSIEVGKKADFLVLPKRSGDPFEDLLNSEPKDIVLSLQNGVPVYGDAKFFEFASQFGQNIEKVKLFHKEIPEKFMVGSPTLLLKKIRNELGYKKDLAFLPILE